MITGVHHITLLVRDLEKAVLQWQQQLGIDAVLCDDLPGRGVKTARFKTGDVWLVLVQPVADGEPKRVLEERGEGLFLLSLGVESLQGGDGSGCRRWRCNDCGSAPVRTRELACKRCQP